MLASAPLIETYTCSKMSLSETFLLFCENAEIRVEAVNPVQYGELYRVSRNGEYAYMTIFDNGNSLPQGQTGSSLYRILQTWSNTVPGSRILSEEERHSLSSLGIPDFYLSWREWDEDADFIQGFINEKGEPEESSASDSYKIHREIMFHDYMFKQATNLVISLEAVRYVITNWLFHFCFMNIDANTLADLVISRLKQFWKEQITADGCVSFYAVVQELPYLFTRYCHDKWVACNSQVVCPQIGNEDACLVELVDSIARINMYYHIRKRICTDF